MRDTSSTASTDNSEMDDSELCSAIKSVLDQLATNNGEPLSDCNDSDGEIVDVDEIGIQTPEPASISLLELLKKMNMGQLVGSIQYHYRSMDVTEVLGFDPYKGRIPLSDSRHCGHCGFSWSRNMPAGTSLGPSLSESKASNAKKTVCPNCSFGAQSTVDYGCMIDTLVKVNALTRCSPYSVDMCNSVGDIALCGPRREGGNCI
jgi:ribosomal protein L37E